MIGRLHVVSHDLRARCSEGDGRSRKLCADEMGGGEIKERIVGDQGQMQKLLNRLDSPVLSELVLCYPQHGGLFERRSIEDYWCHHLPRSLDLPSQRSSGSLDVVPACRINLTRLIPNDATTPRIGADVH